MKKTGKAFTYSLLSVGPGVDPDVQAVSPQVTISHPSSSRLPLLSARPAVTFPAAEHHCLLAGTKLYCLVTGWQRDIGANNFPKVVMQLLPPSRIWINDLLVASPTLYPLRHRASFQTYHCVLLFSTFPCIHSTCCESAVITIVLYLFAFGSLYVMGRPCWLHCVVFWPNKRLSIMWREVSAAGNHHIIYLRSIMLQDCLHSNAI